MTSKDTAPRRAVIYCRISKDRTGAGLGVGKQEADCRTLAAGLGADVVAVLTDNDLTAYKGSSRSKPRPGYNELLDAWIRPGRADMVLAWHTDRVFRDMTELEGYISACGVDNGVPTYTFRSGNLDLTTASGRMVARILGAVQQQEVEHMIERQKTAKERNRKAGAWHGGPRPFGLTPDGLSIKQGGNGGMRQVPAEAAAIAKAYDMILALDPKQGLPTIARQWNDAGLRTPDHGSRGGGNLWDHVNIRNVLLRASNAGLIEHDGEIAGKGNWEPIVSEDTWRAARAVLLDPARRSGPGPSPRWLLIGVLICGRCDGRQFRVMTAGKRYRKSPAYACASLQYAPEVARAAGLGRFHLSREAERLDEYIEWAVIERLSCPEVVAALNTRPEVDIPALDGRRAAINAELGGIAAARFTWQQKEIQSAPLIDELDQIDTQISEALHGDPLPEFTGNDPAKVWAGLKEAGDIDRMRAVARLLLRVRLLPVGRAGNPPGYRRGDRKPFNYDAVEIIWQAS